MALPKSCEIYSRKELAATRHEYFHTTSPRTSLQEGGFIIYDPSFHTIIGSSPTISIIGENTEIPFAHEAGVYIPETGDVFITSNHIRTAGKKSIQISKVSNSEGKYVVEPIEPGIILANGGVNYRDGVLFCEQGSLTEPGGLVYMESKPPYKTEVLISNFHGRWFNSVNDVVVHSDGSVWFTDPTYGFEQGIRPVPQLKNMTYRFDPKSGDIRAVEDTVVKPNGLCFSPDEKTLYITDTEGVHGDTRCPGVYEPARAASIYAFDIITRHSSPFLANKRLFAYADNGIPDGIKCDTLGNVYSGCGDGVHCWSPGGVLIGKIYVPGGCANFCFGREGEVFLLNEHRMWRAALGSGVKGDLLKI